MNTCQVVRWDADETGVTLRIWVDDERAEHVCVAEMRLEESTIVAHAQAVDAEKQRASQYQFEFDQ